MKEVCRCCGNTGERGQFWFLHNYYGIRGIHCTKCYDKVLHDSYGNPINPTEYLMILLKQEKKIGKKT